MRAPSPMQQFRLWRDYGGPGTGGFHLFRWNDLTGERRAAYINHMTIGGLEFLGFLVALLGLVLYGKDAEWSYEVLVAVFLAVLVIHGIVMVVRKETFWQLVWREQQHRKQDSHDNLQQLMEYADTARKGAVK